MKYNDKFKSLIERFRSKKREPTLSVAQSKLDDIMLNIWKIKPRLNLCNKFFSKSYFEILFEILFIQLQVHLVYYKI